MAKCTINGVEVEVEDGSTVIQAFKKANTEIAHYCWHPGLSIAGVCRLCMVEVEGNPRLQIACNTVVQDGMVVSNQSEMVKETVKWGLDFHLINHPLDCPICDQAGECELQNQYMKFGQYDPEMAEGKVKKHKVVDLGPRVVLDSERCILCSRCVRFTDEVTKTNELGIFNRGDRSEIGTFDGKPLENDYSLNTVDICPVGALTSKDFRFKQRVWFLKKSPSVCSGCATGCNVDAYYNKASVFRFRPRHNPDVNGYWMCDEGRDTYKQLIQEKRLLTGKKRDGGEWNDLVPGEAAKYCHSFLEECRRQEGPETIALVLTAQYTNEEFEFAVKSFTDYTKGKNVYHWVNNSKTFDDFDGLLKRGDKNPNTKGLLKTLESQGCQASWTEFEEKIKSSQIKTVIVAGPQDTSVYPDLKEKIELFGKSLRIIWCSAQEDEALYELGGEAVLIPQKTHLEKRGTLTNFNGVDQKIDVVTTIVSRALNLKETFTLMTGGEIVPEVEGPEYSGHVKNETRVINELVHERGRI